VRLIVHILVRQHVLKRRLCRLSALVNRLLGALKRSGVGITGVRGVDFVGRVGCCIVSSVVRKLPAGVFFRVRGHGTSQQQLADERPGRVGREFDLWT
jgi:hypothetical protein